MIKLLGAVALVALGALAVWAFHDQAGAPYVSYDGYQYLDAASNVASGDCMCTRLAHFDEQVASGHMPIPFTHFPPGYPLLVAAASRVGFSLEIAGYFVSAAGYLIALWMLWDIALLLGASPWVAGGFGLLWVAHATALSAASTIGTEAPFTAVLMILAALMVRDVLTDGNRPGLLLGIGLAAGAGYWIRYAGLFLIPVALAFILWRHRKSRHTGWAAAGLLAMLGPMLALQARNVKYSGSWKGGFAGGASHSIVSVLIESGKAFYHLVFGDRVVSRVELWTVVFAVGLVAAAVLTLKERKSTASAPWTAYFWLGLLAVTYVGGIMAAALTSIASDYPRYYLPLYPLALAVAAAGFSMVPVTAPRLAALGMALAGVIGIQAKSLQVASPVAPHLVVERALEQEMQPGVSSKQWLTMHVAPDEVVVAVDGQAVHYVLHRPVISVIAPQFSSRAQDAEGFHALMKRYRSRYLVVFPGWPPEAMEDQESIPFLKGLASGDEPPDWLTMAGRSTQVEILECVTCWGD